jgi:hypothetical protein
MSAPVVERPRAGAATRTALPVQRTAVAPRPASTERVPRDDRGADRRRTRSAPRPPARVVSPGRAQFVLTVMVLLGIGLVATLWLSTAAAADSYRLQDARTAARELSERSERLHREVAALQSPPALAQRATQLGMVPAKDPARLVVAADGTVRVVGEPAPAVAPPPAALPGGLAGAVAPPTTRSVTAPAAAPEQVAAAAVAAAKPAVEAARKAEEEATGQDGEQDGTDSAGDGTRNGTDSVGDGTRNGTDSAGDAARNGTARSAAAGDGPGQDGTDQESTGRNTTGQDGTDGGATQDEPGTSGQNVGQDGEGQDGARSAGRSGNTAADDGPSSRGTATRASSGAG